MDLGLFVRVLWRFKVIVAIGALLAAGLAVFSVARVSPHGLQYRQSALYASTARLGVTQNGFPWGRLLAQDATPEETAARLGIPIADPNRLNGLAVLYAQLATSDPVRALLRKEGPIRGQIMANPVIVGDSRILLPLIDVTAISTTPAQAIRLAQRATTALDRYLTEQQARNNVPSSDRVVVETIQRAEKASVYQPRSKTLAIIVFGAVMFATIGLVFLLENLRPGTRPESQGSSAQVQKAPRRLSA